MIEEKDLTGERLASTVTGILGDPGRLSAMEDASRAVARPDAAARVADLLVGAHA
jgi:UDP-N-acetylglucosamine--N-acetylmuramyl-(pentapeptide) pyrophosphoryl-undecaprenol N-acetylglucosamine transferase